MKTASTKAYLIGGGIGSLAAAAFMIRDGSLPGGNISNLQAPSQPAGQFRSTDFHNPLNLN